MKLYAKIRKEEWYAMLNFKKVKERDDSKGSLESKTSQRMYNKKVDELRKACDEFKSELNKINSPKAWKKAFDNSFKDQLKKNRLTSRTSRVLHDMSNKLSKFKEESFDPKKVKEYKKAFKFTAKKANSKGDIKRSAIDDKEVDNFFNKQIDSILDSGKKVSMKSDSVIAEKIGGSLEENNKFIKSAEKIIAKIDKSIENIEKEEIDEKAKERFINDLNENKKKLVSLIKKMKRKGGILKSALEKPDESQTAKAEVTSKENDKNRQLLINSVGKIEVSLKKIGNAFEKAKDDNESSDIISKDGKILTIKDSEDFGKVKELGVANSIEEIVIKNNITNIPRREGGMFKDFKSLKKVDLGNVHIIGQASFSGCEALQEVVGIKMSSVNIEAFSGCKALAKVTLPKDAKQAKKVKAVIINQTGKKAEEIEFINDPDLKK